MIDIRPILAETHHAMLFHMLNQCLPKLFGFKKAAIMMRQAKGEQLYNVAVEDPKVLEDLYKNSNYSEENVFVYPCNMGITGLAY